jgi:hypothetical protein
MIIFNLTIHHLWGRVLTKFQETRVVACVDDGYIKAKLSVTLQVLAELKTVFKEDADLEINVHKTVILPKGITQESVFDVAHNILTSTPVLTHLSADVTLASFCPEGFVGIGLPIGTDAFVRSFQTTCRDIIDDVEKLDVIQDGFIHFHLLRFCQVTRLQYINSHIMLTNHCVFQQLHVHMILHLPAGEGGFGVTFNDVTKDASFYTTTSRFVT